MGGVVISMIGCGRRDGTRHCLERALATAPDAFFILTNNASKDGTGEMFEEIRSHHHTHRIHTFHEVENTGFIPPGNRAFRIAAERGAEFLILLNDDTDPPERWLERLLEPFANPNVALVCPKGTCCTLDHNFHGSGGEHFEYAEGSCLAIRIAAIRSFSTTLFDENLTGIYGDDSNLSLRAREKGFEIAQADFDMPHIRSATTRSPEVSAFCEFHQKKNHEYNVRRWGHYLKVRHFRYPIILRRHLALGDVILMTPIVRAIKESNPLSEIHIQTDFPQVFEGNPNVTRAAKAIEPMRDALEVNLNGAYEDAPMRHVLEAYEERTRASVTGLGKIEWRTELFPSRKDTQWASAMKARADGRRICVIHGDPSHWPGKHVEPRIWELAASKLRRDGNWSVYVIGSSSDRLQFGHDFDIRGQTSLLQMAAFLAQADLFMGPDSGPMHVSQAAGCPTIGLFGVTSARYLMTHGSKHAPVEASQSIASAGLRHRRAGIVFLPDGKDAMDSITGDSVLWAIDKLAA